ncbi:MAG: response regulator [Gemmatimonadota bacterium]
MIRVLMVDDDPVIRRALRLRFERAGFAVTEAESAAQALKEVGGDTPPDGIVCDVMMPGMNGIEFYNALGKAAPALKARLVFLTGASREPAVHTQIEQLGVPLLGKLDDFQLVIDAIRVLMVTRRTS